MAYKRDGITSRIDKLSEGGKHRRAWGQFLAESNQKLKKMKIVLKCVRSVKGFRCQVYQVGLVRQVCHVCQVFHVSNMSGGSSVSGVSRMSSVSVVKCVK